MTIVPLAAGEFNRPYVGETEKLLIDIMSRANTIPYLICAMTIDEIDGLVPKRDNNVQQPKVEGISVLLSHIEGVKNIPSLIVFGATNQRNMMGDAFLRHLTEERLDFLVKITTNFSGSAMSALKSSILIFLGDNPQSLSDYTLLSLADNTAREFSCWFGSETLPEICRKYPNILDSGQKDLQLQKFSLVQPEMSPSGRILIDLQEKTCFIELSNGPTQKKTLEDGETSLMTLLARLIHGCFSRNIDTIQIIDTNFLTKNNAFNDDQIFELLTTTFLECNEYNRSMIIFDIDSLIMLNLSDSNMSQSLSISNIRLYQFIREKCKQYVVEKKSNGSDLFAPKEKWIVMIVKHPLLRSRIVEDTDFKKSAQQLQQEEEHKEKQRDDETEKTCPKCHQNYISSKTNYGNCRYHDGYVYSLELKKCISNDEAQAILQKTKLLQSSSPDDKQPKLLWACCLGIYGSDPPCRVGICGLPQELQTVQSQTADPTKAVEEHFMKNPKAEAKMTAFIKAYAEQIKLSDTTTTAASSTTTNTSDKRFATKSQRKH
ncbi:unnamed protein product [Rotaria sp. Silwood2]|nr:unnamed protein product [Rotaria sp. Silwood2]CAF4544051.1 unnamed protein product [Rotaria sp. Silwood2]